MPPRRAGERNRAGPLSRTGKGREVGNPGRDMCRSWYPTRRSPGTRPGSIERPAIPGRWRGSFPCPPPPRFAVSPAGGRYEAPLILLFVFPKAANVEPVFLVLFFRSVGPGDYPVDAAGRAVMPPLAGYRSPAADQARIFGFTCRCSQTPTPPFRLPAAALGLRPEAAHSSYS